MASPLNPVVVPIVTYVYLFCLPLSEQPQPPTQWKDLTTCRGLVPIERVAEAVQGWVGFHHLSALSILPLHPTTTHMRA
jgi:hypothetical protein